jgi:AcrR family transcriptional regulator
MKPDKKQSTRSQILENAVQIASVQGLQGLSINSLAQSLSMSKSGVFAHFGSKEDLQIATLDTAWTIFSQCLTAPPELSAFAQVQHLLEQWLNYLESDTFAGGCVFMAASSELDGKPGIVRDHLIQLVSSAVFVLIERIKKAQENQQLMSGLPPEQMAFELHAFLLSANLSYQLSRDKHYFAIAKNAIFRHLEQWQGSNP